MKLALCIAALVATSCGGAGGAGHDTAGKALAAYISALQGGSSKRAYSMLSKDVRRRLTFARFDKRWRAHERERKLRAKALKEARAATPDLGARARVRFKDGKAVSLSQESSRWRLDRALWGGAAAKTPREAVRALTQAISSADFEKFVAVLSRRKRETLVRMLQSFSKSLSAGKDRHVQQFGDDRAHMFWEDKSGRYEVSLVREEGEWRIDDFDIALREDADDEASGKPECDKSDPLCGL